MKLVCGQRRQTIQRRRETGEQHVGGVLEAAKAVLVDVALNNNRKSASENLLEDAVELDVDALAAEAPWWTPGEGHGYAAITYGWLVGELLRRADGRGPGESIVARVRNGVTDMCRRFPVYGAAPPQ